MFFSSFWRFLKCKSTFRAIFLLFFGFFKFFSERDDILNHSIPSLKFYFRFPIFLAMKSHYERFFFIVLHFISTFSFDFSCFFSYKITFWTIFTLFLEFFLVFKFFWQIKHFELFFSLLYTSSNSFLEISTFWGINWHFNDFIII